MLKKITCPNDRNRSEGPARFYIFQENQVLEVLHFLLNVDGRGKSYQVLPII